MSVLASYLILRVYMGRKADVQRELWWDVHSCVEFLGSRTVTRGQCGMLRQQRPSGQSRGLRKSS